MLQCRNLTVSYGSTRALSDVDLDLDESTVGALIGPSGSGKSTLLRVVAGLEHPDRGSVKWSGRDLHDVPAHARGFGLMFQDYALFPHLDVAGNVGFALEIDGWPAARRHSRVEELLGLVGLAGFSSRAVADLSGGEQQRVALARTLAPAPGLVLLDEPLGALDRALRDELLPEMRAIFHRLETTVLYVTHDHDEAFAVADAVFVMRAGAIVGSGTPAELWTSPPDVATAAFFGFGPMVSVTVEDGHADLGFTTIATGKGAGAYVAALAPGALFPEQGGPLAGVVRDVRYGKGRYTVDVSAGDLLATVTSTRAWNEGDGIDLQLDPDAVVLYPVDN